MSEVVQYDDREFQTRLREYLERAPEEARSGLRDGAEVILSDAQANCPVEWGTLQGSGTTDDSNLKNNEMVIGFNTDYAAAVHERLDVHHTQGEAKYLENALKRGIAKLGRWIADRLKQLK